LKIAPKIVKDFHDIVAAAARFFSKFH